MLWRRKELRRRRTSKSHLLLFPRESMVRARRFRQLTSQRWPTSASLSARCAPHRIEHLRSGEPRRRCVPKPDGLLVLLVLNSSSKRVTFNVGWEKKFAVYTLPANSAATLTWQCGQHY